MVSDDEFGEVLVEAILGTGLNEITAAHVTQKVMIDLKSGSSAAELLRHFRNADKVRSVAIAWNARCELHAVYKSAEDKVRALDDIRGIGKLTAQKLVQRLGQ